MIFKSSPAMRDAWCQFSLSLANYHITKDGKKVNKREVFERFYEEPVNGCNRFIEHNHTELALIMAGMHSEYILIQRTDLEEKQNDIDEIIYDELRKRAVILARGLNISKKFNDTVSAMIEAMKYAIENYSDINHSAIGKIVNKKS